MSRSRPPARSASMAALLVGLLLLGAAELDAQEACYVLADAPPGACPDRVLAADSDWGTHALSAGINMAIGGLTSAIRGAGTDAPVWRRLLDGAIGGGVHYAGKALDPRSFPGAGFFGRQTAAVGGSIVANASEGRAPLDRLVLPLGPLRLDLDPGGPDLMDVRIDLPTVAGTLHAFLLDEAEFDAAASLSSGALVFAVPIEYDGWRAQGASVGGVIFHRDHGESGIHDWIVAHESVHVAQHDFAMTVWSAPAERAILRGMPKGHWRDGLIGRIDLGLYVGAKLPLERFVLSYEDRPWEREAFFLAGDGPRPPADPIPLAASDR